MQLVNFIIDLLHHTNQSQISCLLTTTQRVHISYAFHDHKHIPNQKTASIHADLGNLKHFCCSMYHMIHTVLKPPSPSLPPL